MLRVANGLDNADLDQLGVPAVCLNLQGVFIYQISPKHWNKLKAILKNLKMGLSNFQSNQRW